MSDVSGTKSLYICYFGVREPLVRTQVLPYLLEIAKGGTEMHLLTFEPVPVSKWSSGAAAVEKKRLADLGITWHSLTYHKSPSVPATIFDIVNGARSVRSLHSRFHFDIFHCRVHVAALMGAIAKKFSRKKPKLIFDIRGFFPEEYTDAGIWPKDGAIYRTVKRVERWLLNTSDGFVVLTEKAREILFPVSKETGRDASGRPVEVIPCCVDLERFADIAQKRETVRSEIGATDRYVVAYVGSFGGWYLSEETYDLFSALRENDPNSFVMVLTQRDVEKVRERLLSIGFTERDIFVGSVSPEELPEYLSAADAAVSLIKPCYSKQASSPTKNAEYLAAGLPIIANTGVGDVDEQIGVHKVGVMIERFDREALIESVKAVKLLGNISDACRASAQELFDLKQIGGERYRRLYNRILCNKSD